MNAPRPSSFALWILTHSMAPNIRYAATGDLQQIFGEIAESEGPAAAQRWLWKEASLNDPDGNKIIIYEAGKNRKNPPWRI